MKLWNKSETAIRNLNKKLEKEIKTAFLWLEQEKYDHNKSLLLIALFLLSYFVWIRYFVKLANNMWFFLWGYVERKAYTKYLQTIHVFKNNIEVANAKKYLNLCEVIIQNFKKGVRVSNKSHLEDLLSTYKLYESTL